MRKIRSNLIDLTGLQFGQWTVIKHTGEPSKTPKWICKCSCGHVAVVAGQHLRNGASTKCKSCATSKQLTKHGQSRAPLYKIYAGILDRCRNQNRKEFKNYGGRGIEVCDRWLQGFEFFKEDMGERPSKRHSIERKDNDGPYSPENCYWADREQQARNTRHNRWIEFNGERMILKDWAKKLGLTQQALLGRFAKGWPVERALTEPGGSRHGPQKAW